MLVKTAFLSCCAGLSVLVAAAANDTNTTLTAASLQYRLVELDLGYQLTSVALEDLAAGAEDVTSDNAVIAIGNVATSQMAKLNLITPTVALPEASQLVVCQAFHAFTNSAIEVYRGFVAGADEFDRDQRNELQNILTSINDEIGGFFIRVISVALPTCKASLQLDEKVINDYLTPAIFALDPSEAPPIPGRRFNIHKI